MAYLLTRGLVLFAKKCRESDRRLILLTPEHGLIFAYAYRAAKSQTRMAAGTQPFMLCEFNLSEKKGFYTLHDLDIIASFTGLQSHIERLIVAAHMVDVARDVAVDIETGRRLYELLAHALYVLSSASMDERLIAATYNWKVMALTGYAPVIAYQGDKGGAFSLDDGRINSDLTHESLGCRMIPVSHSAILAIRYIIDQPSAKAFSYYLDPKHAATFFDLSSQYLCEKLEKNYPQLSALSALYDTSI